MDFFLILFRVPYNLLHWPSVFNVFIRGVVNLSARYFNNSRRQPQIMMHEQYHATFWLISLNFSIFFAARFPVGAYSNSKSPEIEIFLHLVPWSELR